MLSVQNLSLQFGKRILFDEVNAKFVQGNCYGVIGANGAGKSTFLKILIGEQDPTTGRIELEPGKRIAFLRQNHFEFDEFPVLQTVIMGHHRLYEIMQEKDMLYSKEDFTEKDGMRTADLEAEFADLEGWNAETDAATLLSNLGIFESNHELKMKEIPNELKVRVLLAQALFGNPDVLILDEPTNDLDLNTITWLEDFLLDFKNTVIVVSHDRHFLDTVCTHICDIDFSKINLFTGNYSFWYESSQLATRQRSDKNKKAEEKKKELMDFISRFSANAAKSKQATSRRKMLDNLDLEEIKPSSRRYPGITFHQDRDAGNQILQIENLSKSHDGKMLFKDANFTVNKGDRIALISKNSVALSQFYQILNKEIKPDTGEFIFGTTISTAYLPNDNHHYFSDKTPLIDWLRNYADTDEEREEVYLRTFLGRMLFTGEEAMKTSNVLSGGEKVRCMLSKMMLAKANFLMMDEPTNHLDLESITALNNAMKDFQGTLIFTSHDQELVNTVSNRIIELTPKGLIDKMMPFDAYIKDPKIITLQQEMYA
ncbi:MAG: ATP-binding cassette domain-containing protein [Flavobacteriia bacterium]|jgi:ATPase subunit of ABC transporter with duplicated ATPase domains|nr:ATP-binding cassette domain-containing protein [Flavobacteriia bacterium]NBV91865.1 ATP-binding cassette domain-containing protein [Flavobacteriia bacterium]NBY41306.1 ATP-binding cassette domain-containing protein [Flavobacteriia bacterium]